jgi:hypothetical protein
MVGDGGFETPDVSSSLQPRTSPDLNRAGTGTRAKSGRGRALTFAGLASNLADKGIAAGKTVCKKTCKKIWGTTV